MMAFGLLATMLTLAACGDPEPLPSNGGDGGSGSNPGGSGGGDGGTGSGGSGGEGGVVVVPCAGGCPAGETCSVATDTCIPIETCTPACGAGFTCESGVCVAGSGGIGTPCGTGADCASGTCAQSLSGEQLCVAPCGIGCPAGTHCIASAQLCMGDQNADCTGVNSCGATASCTVWASQGGTPFSSCSFDEGATFEGLPCTTGADCRTGLCSAPNVTTGERVCTAPCVDEFGCRGLEGTCTVQEVLTPTSTMSLQVCDAPARPLGFGECCTDDAECDTIDTIGCRPALDGLSRSCASRLECLTSDDCFFFVAGQPVDGDCVESHCVARACINL